MHDLTRRFGEVVAADRVNMSVDAGETFGLLGPNGAGKTTVIKMLTTLLPPSSGSAEIAGLDIKSQANSVRRVIGYVPQMISVDGELTGYENLRVFARLYDVPRAEQRDRIEEALDLIGRETVWERIDELNGGRRYDSVPNLTLVSNLCRTVTD